MNRTALKLSILVMVFMMALTGMFVLPVDADNGSNDDFANAEAITHDIEYVGTVDSVDVADYYQFPAGGGERIRVDFNASDPVYSISLTLYDSSQNWIFEISSTGGVWVWDEYYTKSETSQSSIWYLVVEYNGEGQYRFRVTQTMQNDAGKGNDASETSGTAGIIGPGTYSGHVEDEDTIDFYHFNTGAGDIVRLDFKAADPVYSISCELLDDSLNWIFELDSSNNLTETDTYYTSSETPYTAWSIKIEQSGIGYYEFTLNITNQNDAGIGTDAPGVTGSLIPCGSGTYYGHLEDMDERDLFGILFDGGSIIEVEFTSYSTDYNIDLYLFDNENSDHIHLSSMEGVTYSGECITKNETDDSGWYFEIDQNGIGDYEFTITINPQNDAGSGDDANSWETQDPSVVVTDGSYSGECSSIDNSDTYRIQVLPSMVLEVEFSAVDDNPYNQFAVYKDWSTTLFMVSSSNGIPETGKWCFEGDIEPFDAIISVASHCEYSFTLSHWFQNDSGLGKDAYSKDTGLQNSDPLIEGDYTGFLYPGDYTDNYRVNVPSGSILAVTVDPDDELTTLAYIKDTNGYEKVSDSYNMPGEPSEMEYDVGTEGGDYVISVVYSSGEGEYSLLVNITDAGELTVPSAPRNVEITPGPGVINLTWDAPASDGGSPITYYKLYRADSEFGSYSFHSAMYLYGALEWSDDFNVVVGQTYYYKIAAVNAEGEGENSSVVSAAALPMGDDTDGDGMPDDWEDQYGLDKDDPSDATDDEDEDGLDNVQEYQQDTDPTDEDTDSDGMTDGWEFDYGLDPTNSVDANSDMDGDFATNLEEFEGNSDPTDANDLPAVDDDDDDDDDFGIFGATWFIPVTCCCLLIIVVVIVLLIIIIIIASKKKKGKGKKAKADKKDDEEE